MRLSSLLILTILSTIMLTSVFIITVWVDSRIFQVGFRRLLLSTFHTTCCIGLITFLSKSALLFSAAYALFPFEVKFSALTRLGWREDCIVTLLEVSKAQQRLSKRHRSGNEFRITLKEHHGC